MASLSDLVGDAIGRVLRRVSVAAVEPLAGEFRRLRLEGEDLRGVRALAGEKVQIVVPGGPVPRTRTYTPFAVDAARGSLDVLVYHHGDGPGSTWARGVRVGDRLRLVGPRGSLDLTSLRGAVVLFGDETSIGVVRALREHRGASDDVAAVLEVGRAPDTAAVCAAVGVAGVDLVEKRPDDAHAAEVDQRVRAALARRPATLVLTGRAQSIQALKASLRARPVSRVATLAKPYWAVGKRGLD